LFTGGCAASPVPADGDCILLAAAGCAAAGAAAVGGAMAPSSFCFCGLAGLEERNPLLLEAVGVAALSSAANPPPLPEGG
jgi:hypothetical protein